MARRFACNNCDVSLEVGADLGAYCGVCWDEQADELAQLRADNAAKDEEIARLREEADEWREIAVYIHDHKRGFPPDPYDEDCWEQWVAAAREHLGNKARTTLEEEPNASSGD